MSELADAEKRDTTQPDGVAGDAPANTGDDTRNPTLTRDLALHWDRLGVDGRILATEMAKASARYATSCWDCFHEPPADGPPEGVDPEAWYEVRRRRRREAPLDWVHWEDLAEAEREEGSEAATLLWGYCRGKARDELATGHRAAVAVQQDRGKPMDRARFLELRKSLADEWQPRGGIEERLLDMLAQAFTMWEQWVEIAAGRTSMQCFNDENPEVERHSPNKANRSGWWHRPLQSTADAIKAANDEADRWNRVFMRTLRQLRDLRRYSVIINADQVNIANHQTLAPSIESAPVTIAQEEG